MKDYNAIPLGDTAELSNEEWLNWRKHGPFYKDPMDERYIPYTIGGSDFSVLADVNPWKTILELYHEKSGIEPKIKKEFNAEAKEAGHVFELFVAAQFLRYMKKEFPSYKIELIKDPFVELAKILPLFELPLVKPIVGQFRKILYKKWGFNPNMLFQCGETDENGKLLYPFLLGNMDGFVRVNGKLGILECKTTSSRNIEAINKWKSGVCPEYYEYQCRDYMKIHNLDFCYIVCCWGFTLDDMAVVLVKRDTEIEDTMMKMATDFITHCELGIEPNLTNTDKELLNQYYTRLYGKVDESKPVIELSDNYRDTILKAMLVEDDVIKAEEALENAKKRKEEIYSELYPVFQDSAYGSYRLDDNTVIGIKLVTPMKRAKFDEERFKTEHPDIYDKYSKTVLDTTSLGKKEKLLKKEYTLPAEVNLEEGRKTTFQLKRNTIPV